MKSTLSTIGIHMTRLILSLLSCLLLVTPLNGQTSEQVLPEPAVMSLREIRPPDSLPGESIPLDFPTTGTVSLFIPTGYVVPESGAIKLTMHFHGAPWYATQEHLRRGMVQPLVTFALGEGSTIYRKPFEDQAQFMAVVQQVEEHFKSSNVAAHVESVALTSFSAGYGAVREIIKSPENVALINRIVLGDSSYGSLDEAALAAGNRVVSQEHVTPWANFAQLAAKGEKTLLMTTSEITPNTYAGTHEVARAVAVAVGAEVVAIAPESSPASAADVPYPLAFRADLGGFHWWGYKGEDAVVHMTLARHIAEDWLALDAAGNP